MTRRPRTHVEERGPTELRDPVVREELKRAAVWIGLALAVAGIIFLAQPLLLIVAGIVFSAILDGGTRLLGRPLRIGRGWRLTLVTLAGFGVIIGTLVYTGVTLVGQVEGLRAVVSTQLDRLLSWGNAVGVIHGKVQFQQFSDQLMGSLGRLTSVVGSALGAVSSLAMIVVIGIFVAMEPRLYERGVAWMLPLRSRGEFYRTAERMGRVLRRLMAGRLVGMGVEGIGVWVLLSIVGVPMAPLLGILTGLLAFIPNIGAIVSGVLIVLVSFSSGTEQGIWGVAVYLVVQSVDGYLIVPYVARRTVDLAPALVLGCQLLFGALFGILGLALADPIVAMIKTALEQKSLEADDGAAANPAG